MIDNNFNHMKSQRQRILLSCAVSLIAVIITSYFVVQLKAESLVSTNQITDKAITTPMMADAAVTTLKLADQSVTSAKIAGVSKIIFADCNINFGPINPNGRGVADCSVRGTTAGDNVVATPNNGLIDAMSFFSATTLDGKVRFLIHNNVGVALPATPTRWSVIVFHK
jgi:hypothetical protein